MTTQDYPMNGEPGDALTDQIERAIAEDEDFPICGCGDGMSTSAIKRAAQIARAVIANTSDVTTLTAQERRILQAEVLRWKELFDQRGRLLFDLAMMILPVENNNAITDAYGQAVEQVRKMRAEIERLKHENAALKEKANKVYRLRQDWLADDDKAVEFYNSIKSLGRILDPNIAPTTGEQEAAALRATLAAARKTVEEYKRLAQIRCEEGAANPSDNHAVQAADAAARSRLAAYQAVLALLGEGEG